MNYSIFCQGCWVDCGLSGNYQVWKRLCLRKIQMLEINIHLGLRLDYNPNIENICIEQNRNGGDIDINIYINILI